MSSKTLNSDLSDAELCRQNGWPIGTFLVGDEGYGPTVIEITAIGSKHILASSVLHKGEPCSGGEVMWTLKNRDWKVV